MERIGFNFCQCGCGKQVSKHGNIFILGHGRKNKSCSEIHKKRVSKGLDQYWGKKQSPQLCACGCGQLTNVHKRKARKYVLGHNQKDKTYSYIHKERLSLNKKQFYEDNIMSAETKKLISEGLKIYYSNIENKKKNRNWMGGISYEPYGQEFNFDLKQSIRKYNGNICQFCGKSELESKIKLSIHHIDYNKKNNDPSNLISLCTFCHVKTNHNRKHWQYLMERIKHEETQDYTKAILVSDIHLRETTPICRTDDYFNVQINKLQFIKDLQKEHQCPVIAAGDIFDHWKPSPFMVSTALSYLPKNMWSVIGNHDAPNHNLQLLNKSGLGVLACTGTVRILRGTHFGEIPEYPSLVMGGRKILVWHKLAYQIEPFPGAIDGNAKQLLQKYSNYDIILTGDNHKTFIEEYEGRLLVNPGSMMRMTADQVDHKPCVFLWYAETNTVEQIFLPIEEGIISREHLVVKEERDKRIDAFISRLDGSYETTVSFEQNLEMFFQTNEVENNVKQIIYQSIE